MADAIENLAQDLNQSNTVDEFPGYPGYQLGQEVPKMVGVRVGDLFYGYDQYGQQAPYNWRTGVFEFAAPPTTPANPDSQFESYLAGIKDLQAPVSSPNQPYTPTFTPMAAPPAVRVSPPAKFGPVTASGYAQPPVDPMSYYSNPSTASLRNLSTLGGGSEIDYNIPDNPTVRINEGSTDEQDARVYTPRNQEQYIKGENVLVSPGDLGGTIGVVDVNPDDFIGQTPSVIQGVVTRGETVKIPGKGLPNYEVIGKFDNGDIIYADPKNTRDSFIVPSVKDYPGVVDLSNLPEVVSNVGGGGFRQGTRAVSTPIVPFQETAASVGASEPVTTSQGGFNNTGGSVAVGPDNRAAGPGGAINVTPGYIKPPSQGKTEDVPLTWSPAATLIDEIKNIPKGSQDSDSLRREIYERFDPTHTLDKPFTGLDEYGREIKWNWDERLPGRGSWGVLPPPSGGGTPNPPKSGDEGTTTPAPGGGTGTTPTPGGGTTPTPGGGVRPGTGTGTGIGTTLPPREPVTPLVRRETVIPTKGTKEVPIPDRQADPFAKLYADLLANAQQQKDQYRYINYDPEQIMNAAMSGFRRRGAMRSLQG